MKKIKRLLIISVIAIIAFLWPITALAGNIASSKLATGTEQLIKDATSWLLVVAPLVTVIAVIYYFIRKTVSDEMDHSAATRCRA